MSNKTDLKGLKRKIRRLVALRDEILQDMFNQDISIFERSGRPFTLFGIALPTKFYTALQVHSASVI